MVLASSHLEEKKRKMLSLTWNNSWKQKYKLVLYKYIDFTEFLGKKIFSKMVKKQNDSNCVLFHRNFFRSLPLLLDKEANIVLNQQSCQIYYF